MGAPSLRFCTRCHMLGPERPEAVLPDRQLHLPTFSHLLIVNKLLSLFFSLYTYTHACMHAAVEQLNAYVLCLTRVRGNNRLILVYTRA